MLSGFNQRGEALKHLKTDHEYQLLGNLRPSAVEEQTKELISILKLR